MQRPRARSGQVPTSSKAISAPKAGNNSHVAPTAPSATLSPMPTPAEAGTAARAKLPSPRRRKFDRLLFVITWISGVLAAAAAVLFGVWAPLSYKATAAGNRDNNMVQSSLVAALETANGVANSALSAVRSQVTALEDTQSRLNAMGQLALLSYCQPLTVRLT